MNVLKAEFLKSNMKKGEKYETTEGYITIIG